MMPCSLLSSAAPLRSVSFVFTRLTTTSPLAIEALLIQMSYSYSCRELVYRKKSLKGTSKKLKIYVATKADQKAVKKQLKKAGNKKAKVKVGYRLK